MSVAKTIVERLRAYRRYRKTVTQLSRLSKSVLYRIRASCRPASPTPAKYGIPCAFITPATAKSEIVVAESPAKMGRVFEPNSNAVERMSTVMSSVLS